MADGCEFCGEPAPAGYTFCRAHFREGVTRRFEAGLAVEVNPKVWGVNSMGEDEFLQARASLVAAVREPGRLSPIDRVTWPTIAGTREEILAALERTRAQFPRVVMVDEAQDVDGEALERLNQKASELTWSFTSPPVRFTTPGILRCYLCGRSERVAYQATDTPVCDTCVRVHLT